MTTAYLDRTKLAQGTRLVLLEQGSDDHETRLDAVEKTQDEHSRKLDVMAVKIALGGLIGSMLGGGVVSALVYVAFNH